MPSLSDLQKTFFDKFPETGWMCPYCVVQQSELNKCTVDRVDIPSHLVYQHQWEAGPKLTWKYIFTRLSTIGGV